MNKMMEINYNPITKKEFVDQIISDLRKDPEAEYTKHFINGALFMAQQLGLLLEEPEV
jgi:uncharacterized protein YjbK